MMRLQHLPLCPNGRAIRLSLGEARVPFTPVEIDAVGRLIPDALQSAGDPPYLDIGGGVTVVGVYAIAEHLDERLAAGDLETAEGGLARLLPVAIEDRAEARRLVEWFQRRLEREVTSPLLALKLLPRLSRTSPVAAPEAEAIRPLHTALHRHLDYLDYLADSRRWLAGEELGLADFAAAGALSVLDYLGEVPWDAHEPARMWYARMKSRPAFRPLLADALPQCPPSAHYADLDF